MTDSYPDRVTVFVVLMIILILGAMVLLDMQEREQKAREAAEWAELEPRILAAYPIHYIQHFSPNGTIYSCAEKRAIYGEMITFCDDSTMYPSEASNVT